MEGAAAIGYLSTQPGISPKKLRENFLALSTRALSRPETSAPGLELSSALFIPRALQWRAGQYTQTSAASAPMVHHLARREAFTPLP